MTSSTSFKLGWIELVPESTSCKSLVETVLVDMDLYLKEITICGDQFSRELIFADSSRYKSKPKKICPRKVYFILLSAKISPCEIFVELSFGNVSVLERIILLFNTLIEITANYTDSVSTYSVILQNIIFPRYYHTRDINVTYLTIAKLNPWEIVKISPATNFSRSLDVIVMN